MIISLIESKKGKVKQMGNIETETQNKIDLETKQNFISLVCDGITSQHTKRAYTRALSEFLDWNRAQGKPDLTKALVQSYKTHLESLGRGASSINQALSAIRKLAVEASDNGLIPEQIANGIKNVSGVRQEGQRTGNWLSKEQAQQLLNSPNCDTLKGLRDRAILAVLLGCGLRREELTTLTWQHVQQRQGRWILVDIIGKRNKTRSVPMPSWAKVAIDAYSVELARERLELAGMRYDAPLFASVSKGGIPGDSMTPQAVRDVVVKYSQQLGFEHIAAHDLRRTFAQLAKKGGSDLEQIQLSLGHSSIVTTERYLGTRQDLTSAPCDKLGLTIE
jgi:site-specific recombinase XerD